MKHRIKWTVKEIKRCFDMGYCGSHDRGLRLGISSHLLPPIHAKAIDLLFRLSHSTDFILTDCIKYASIDLGIKQWTKLTIVIALLKFII